MKKLLITLICCAGLMPFINAQVSEDQRRQVQYDESAIEKIVEGQMRVEFRQFAYENLNLSEEQIVAVDPVFMDYTNAKDSIRNQKFALIDDYIAEMKEDDDADDEFDETGTFLEDYWQNEIAELSLKRQYIDRFDDAIPTEKVVDFFLLEEAVEDRMEEQRFATMMPVLIEIYRYDTWDSDQDKMMDGQKMNDHHKDQDNMDNQNIDQNKADDHNKVDDQNRKDNQD